MKKSSIFLAALLANAVCSVLVFTVPIETTDLKLYGSFLAIILAGILARGFPLQFYAMVMGFVFLASSLGSCINLYHHVGFYDLFVHYLSGIVLAEGGRLMLCALEKRLAVAGHWFSRTLFAVLLSCTGAALWEIYEFCADLLLNAQMQGSKENTMGDIICGVLGAVTYFLSALCRHRRAAKNNPQDR